MHRNSRLAPGLYALPQHDWTEITNAVTQDLALERVLDRRYYLPLPFANDWHMEGPETMTLGANDSRQLHNSALMVNTNAAGGLTVEQSPDTDTALNSYFPGHSIDCEDFPNSPNGFTVKRSLKFEIAAGATSSTNIVETDIIDAAPSANPQRVTPWFTGAVAEQQLTLEPQSLRPIFTQNPTTGQITSVNIGGAATVIRWVRVFEVEWNCPVGRIELTGAQLQSQIDSQYTRFIPSESINQAQLDAGEVYRAFYDPSDTSENLAYPNDYDKRVRYLFRCRAPFIFPALETDIPQNFAASWEFIGPARDYVVGTGVDDGLSMSGQIDLVQEINASSGTPFVPANDPQGFVFGYRLTTGIGTDPRRPVAGRPPTFWPSTNGKVNVVGHQPTNTSEYSNDDVIQVFWLDTSGLISQYSPQWIGPRAIELGFDSVDFSNFGPTNVAQLNDGEGKAFIEKESVPYPDYFVTLGIGSSNRTSVDNGRTGYARTRLYSDMSQQEVFGWQQFQSNFQRSFRVYAGIHNLTSLAATNLPMFTATNLGDPRNGGSLTFDHSSGAAPPSAITSVELNGVAVPLDAGATATQAVISYVYEDFPSGGKMNKVPWGQAFTYKVLWATGESEIGVVSVPIPSVANDQYGMARVGSVGAHPDSTWTLHNAAGHSVAVNDPFYVRSTNLALALTTSGLPEQTDDDTTGDVISWSVVRQEWSPQEFWSFGIDVPVTTGLAPSGLTENGKVAVLGAAIPAANMFSGGVAPLTYSATGLAPGTSISPTTGEITGTPTVAGTYNPVVTVTDANLATANDTFVHEIQVAAPSITGNAPAGTSVTEQQGVAITSIAGAGLFQDGVPALTYSATGLPSGLSIDPTTGVISGTPTIDGTFSPITVTVTDSVGDMASDTFTLEVQVPMPSTTGFAPSGLTINGTENVALASTQTAGMFQDGVAPLVYSATGLAPGRVINSATGEITGTPTTAGTFNPVITVTDANGDTANDTFTQLIAAAPSVPTTTGNPPSGLTENGQVDVAIPTIDTSAMFTGGVAPLVYTATGLAPGTSINSVTGEITGTPTTAGTYNPVITVTDANSQSANDTFTHSIAVAAPSTTGNAPTGSLICYQNEAAGPINYQGMFADGVPTVTYSSTGLPSGMTDVNGVISGTPTVNGTFVIAVTATDANSDTATDSFTKVVRNIRLSDNGPDTGSAVTGVPIVYDGSLCFDNGTLPITYSAVGMPAGLSISSTTGVITGPFSASGTFPFQISAVDAVGDTASKTITFTVADPVIAPTLIGSIGPLTCEVGDPQNIDTTTIFAGTSPTYVITGLPPGLISSAGVITGSATTSGSYTITVMASNSSGSASTTIDKTVTDPVIAPSVVGSLPDLTCEVGENVNIDANPVFAGDFLTISASGLPAGLSVTAGVISGMPSATGTFNVVVTATNSAGSASEPFIKTVNVATIAPTFNGPAPALTCEPGESVNFDASVYFSGDPATFTSVDLPANLVISSAGLITGSVPAAGTFAFSVVATNSAGSATGAFAKQAEVAVVAPTFNGPIPNQTCNIGDPFVLDVSPFFSGDAATYTASGLPANLSISSAGVITGSVSAASITTITVTATNSAGSDSGTFQKTAVNQVIPPSVVGSLPDLTCEVGENVNIDANPVFSGDSLTISAAGLPAGLSLTAGVISGAPSATGTFNVVVTATNSAGTASEPFVKTVVAATIAPVFNGPAPALNCEPGEAVNFDASVYFSGDPATFTSVDLPANLVISSAGLITGSVPAAGIFAFSVVATNSAGSATGAFAKQAEVAVVAPTFNGPIPNQTCDIGDAFVLDVSPFFSGDAATYTASNLPANLSISSAGVITGSVSAASVSTITVTATNSAGSDSGTFQKTAVNQVIPPSFLGGASTINCDVGDPINIDVSVYFSGTGLSFSSPNMPANLAISAAGVISGSAAAAGTYSLTVIATNSAGSDTGVFVKVATMPIAAPTLISAIPAQNCVAGDMFVYDASVHFGGGTATFSATGLPSNLVISANGVISGIVAAAGNVSVTVTATNASGSVGSTFQKTTAAAVVPPTFNGPAPTIVCDQNVPVTSSVTALFAGDNLTFSASGLPSGLTISSTGTITGSVATAGTYNFTVIATNSAGSDTGAFQKQVNSVGPSPLIVSGSSVTGSTSLSEGSAATIGVTSLFSGGTAPITYSATNLPPGMMIDAATGIVSGTPTLAGSYTIVVTATDSASGSASTSFTLSVSSVTSVVAELPKPIPSQNWPGSLAGGFSADDQYPLCYWCGRIDNMDLRPGEAITPINAGAGFQGTATITRYALSGAPYGLVIDSSTGVISGAAFYGNSSANKYASNSVRVIAYTIVNGKEIIACESNSFPVRILQ